PAPSTTPSCARNRAAATVIRTTSYTASGVRGFGNDALPLFVKLLQARFRLFVILVKPREPSRVAGRVRRRHLFADGGEASLGFRDFVLDRALVAHASLLLRLTAALLLRSVAWRTRA